MTLAALRPEEAEQLIADGAKVFAPGVVLRAQRIAMHCEFIPVVPRNGLIHHLAHDVIAQISR